jgi:hypothetical protein
VACGKKIFFGDSIALVIAGERVEAALMSDRQEDKISVAQPRERGGSMKTIALLALLTIGALGAGGCHWHHRHHYSDGYYQR